LLPSLIPIKDNKLSRLRVTCIKHIPKSKLFDRSSSGQYTTVGVYYITGGRTIESLETNLQYW
jgi:hypothetical protein